MEQKKLSVKEKVLAMLEENRGRDISGESIAELLGVSRNAVWKAIKTLQSSGYEIEAVRNRGYRLSLYNDILSVPGIEMYLNKSYKHVPIHIYKSLESTNKTAKHLAIDGTAHGTIVLADSQTAGKGRADRTFFSPEGSGIYLSVILKPDFGIPKPAAIMTAASVAVCRAIENACHLKPEIKWINDLYLNRKKVCGILIDAVLDYEAEKLDALIVGIGINFVPPAEGFPPELEASASALNSGPVGISPEGISRNRLIAEIENEVMQIFSKFPSDNYLEEYRKRSLLIGKEIDIFQKENTAQAKVLDIDGEGGLVVQLKNDSIQTLYSPEITVRIRESNISE